MSLQSASHRSVRLAMTRIRNSHPKPYTDVAPDPLSWRTTSPKNGSSCWLRHAGCGLTFRAAKDRYRTALSCQPSPSPRRAVEESGASTPNPEPPLVQIVIVCGPPVVKPCMSCASGRVATPEPQAGESKPESLATKP